MQQYLKKLLFFLLFKFNFVVNFKLCYIYLGNIQVWYGSIDIFINNDIIFESVDEDKTGNFGGKLVEIKVVIEILLKNGQIIVEIIVFFFLQR